MDVTFATEAAPGAGNDDLVIATDRFVIVLDGVTVLPGTDTGCVHPVSWLVRTLGGILTSELFTGGNTPLPDLLARSLTALPDRHGPDCDLGNPDSPSTTVALLREHDHQLDYLVLCDSSIVLDTVDGYRHVTDDRTSRLPAYDRASVARLRNTPDGFWVASTTPEAARHAVSGSVPLDHVRRAAVLTDGASRLVDRFGRDWSEVFGLAGRYGPRGVLDAVRHAERAEWPHSRGGKQFDDATLAVCTFSHPYPADRG